MSSFEDVVSGFTSPTRQRGLPLPSRVSPRWRVGLVLKFARQVRAPPIRMVAEHLLGDPATRQEAEFSHSGISGSFDLTVRPRVALRRRWLNRAIQRPILQGHRLFQSSSSVPVGDIHRGGTLVIPDGVPTLHLHPAPLQRGDRLADLRDARQERRPMGWHLDRNRLRFGLPSLWLNRTTPPRNRDGAGSRFSGPIVRRQLTAGMDYPGWWQSLAGRPGCSSSTASPWSSCRSRLGTGSALLTREAGR